MGTVPVVDLAPATGAAADRRRVVDAVGQACADIGFLTVAGHGVDEHTVTAAVNAARDFFDLPEAERMAVAFPHPGYPYGYAPVAYETLTRSEGQASPPDLKESYAIGPLEPPRRPFVDPDEAWAFQANLWPERPEGLRPAWEAYYRAMAELAARLLALMAMALDLPETWFDPLIDHHPSAMRALNYPPQSTPPEPGQLRAGAHTDYGTLTILHQQDAPGGLEVETADGSWVPVEAVEGTFVVNLGDSMARWTNDRWRSTRHRVVNPPAGASGTRRQSLAFFHNANWDAVIECLPTCLAPGERPRHPPVAAGPHLMAKFHATVSP